MALITCPECQQQMSDQASSCPHCGYPVNQQPTVFSLDNIQDVRGTSPESSETDAVSREKKRGKRPAIIVSILAVIVIVAVVLVVFSIQAAQQAEREEAERQAALEARSEYITNLESFSFNALTGAATAEKMCNLTKSVWYDTIYEEYDFETVAYTQTNGKYHDDFNTSLAKLYASDEMVASIALIEENRATVDELYKALMDPESEFEKCFEEVEAMYSAYYKFTNLAVSPSGSLKTYAEDFSEYDTDFMEHYDKLELLIPAE